VIIMWPCVKPRPAALCSRLAAYRLNLIMFDQHNAAPHIRINHVQSIQIVFVYWWTSCFTLSFYKKNLHLILGILLVFIQNYIHSCKLSPIGVNVSFSCSSEFFPPFCVAMNRISIYLCNAI